MDRTAFVPPVVGSGVAGSQFLGLSVPDWVGVATIIYLVVTTVIAVFKYLKERKK